MAGSATDAIETDLLKLLSAQATSVFTTTILANLYVALFTTSNTDAAAGTEVATGSYARVQTKTFWGAPSGTSPTQVANNAALTFPTASASWGTVVSCALYDAATVGNRLLWADLTVSKTISSGDTASFAIGALVITCD